MGNNLQELQTALLNMLIDINYVCSNLNIQYSISCGTALGAIRHQGFIPWDDDLDIMLLRTEYEKFLKNAAPVLNQKGYTVQKEFSDEWPMEYSKVRKDNTAYIEEFEPKNSSLHQGIFIDVFPIDNLSDNPIMANIQWQLTHLLVAKGMNKRGYKTHSIIKKIVMFLSPLYPQTLFRRIVMQKNNITSKKVHSFLGGARNAFPRSLFSEYKDVLFEGYEFPMLKDYDAYLKICYKDYMTLPPIEERQAHIHAKIIDLNNSYLIYRNK